MNINNQMGMGWAMFWPALAKVVVAGAVVWLGMESLNLIRDIYVK